MAAKNNTTTDKECSAMVVYTCAKRLFECKLATNIFNEVDTGSNTFKITEFDFGTQIRLKLCENDSL